MSTVEDVARSALASLATNDNVVLAGQWVNERLAEAAAHCRFRHLRSFKSFQIPAAITAGTVTVNRDSDLVIGDPTAQGAFADSTIVGRFFQAGTRTAWYEIVEYLTTPTPSFRLRTPFSENGGAGLSYRIVARQIALEKSDRFVGPFIYQRFRMALEIVAYERLMSLVPERQFFSTGPAFVAEVGEDDQGRKLIELYPYSHLSEIISYVSWEKPTTLQLQDRIPGSVDLVILKQGVQIDVMRYKQSMAANENRMEQAAFWRNEARSQETKWEQAMQYLALTDHGIDDMTFILAMGGSWGTRRDVTDAYGEIFSRGARP